MIDDGEALERPDRLEQPIAAARPDGVPPGRVGFRVSRDLAGVSCVSRSSLEAQGPGVDIPAAPIDLKIG